MYRSVFYAIFFLHLRIDSLYYSNGINDGYFSVCYALSWILYHSCHTQILLVVSSSLVVAIIQS